MERENAAKEEFEHERVKAMVERNEIFECSGTQIHEPSCDGDCEVKSLSDLEIQINEEVRKWAEVGMTPLGSPPQLQQVPGIPVDTLKTSIALAALTQLCYDKLGIDQNELNRKFQEMYLERLVNIREANQEAVLEAKRRAGIAIPGADVMPQIIVPENIRKKMH